MSQKTGISCSVSRQIVYLLKRCAPLSWSHPWYFARKQELIENPHFFFKISNLLSTNFDRQEVNLNTSEDSEDSGDWGSVSEVHLTCDQVRLFDCFSWFSSTQSLLNVANSHTSFSICQHCSNEEILTNTQRARMEIQEIKKDFSQEKPKLKVNKRKRFLALTLIRSP